MINSRNSKRLLIIVLLVVMIALGGVVLAKGECKGASCDPLPPKAQACEHAANNPHCNPPPTNNPPPTPPPTNEPQPSPTMPPIFSSPTPKLSPIGEVDTPTPIPAWPQATRFIPTIVPTEPACSIPASDLGPDDVALLIEAVHEGWTIVIVKDILATSPDVVLVSGN